MTAAAVNQNGVLKVLTFTGTQPFVVRCERDTRVKDIVGAIAEIWGFKEAARLFTLCHPAPGSDLTDPTKLLPGTLLSWIDRPCQAAAAAAAAAAANGTANNESTTAAAGAALQPPPLLLVRYIFGSTASEWDQNHSVLSLTAAQIAADVAASRYPGVAEASLYQHWVKQGQHSVVLHMAASWPSGACLIVGQAQVLSGGAEVQQLGATPVNVGVNSKGIHIMVPLQHKLLMPLDSIACATASGDILNVSFVSGQPDLLLQVPGAVAVAEAFKVHKDAAGAVAVSAAQPVPESSTSSTAAPGPASGKSTGAHMPLWITSPAVERWLQEPTPKDDAQRVSVSIKVLRPWEQTPPVLRVLLTTEQPPLDDRLVDAQLLVIDSEDEGDSSPAAAAGLDADSAGEDTAAAEESEEQQQQPKQKQQRITLQLRVLQKPTAPPEPRVKVTIAPVPAAEQELLTPAPGEEPLVRLVIEPLGQHRLGSTSPLKMLLHKGAAAAGVLPPGIAAAAPPGIAGSSDGVMLRGMQLGVGSMGTDVSASERPHPQLMQRLQHQQQQQHEVRAGLLAGSHLGGPVAQPGYRPGPGMRPATPVRPQYGQGFRPGMPQGQQGWGQQQQYGGSMARPAGMRPMGALPHQPYALVGPPNSMGNQGQSRPSMGSGPMGGHQVGRIMRPQPPQQQYVAQMQHQQQQQYAAMRQPQQQVLMQQGGYMVMQPQQPQMQPIMQQQPMMQQQQHPQMAYTAMPQRQQQPQQQYVMLPAGANTGAPGTSMVLLQTADGRLVQADGSQLQQQQQGVMQGVFVLGPQGELMPSSQPAAVQDQNAGMQQLVLQHQQPQQQQPQQQMMMAQAQGQPMFMQSTPSQRIQQQYQPQQVQQVQFQQPQQVQFQQPQQVAGMAGLGMGGQMNNMGSMNQPQQLQQQQAQPMSLMGLDGQLQLQPQQQQQTYMAVSSAQVGGQGAQLLQLQGMQGMAGTAPVGMGQQSFVMQGQQQQQQPMQQQQQLLVTNAGQQQQLVLQSSGNLVDSNSMGLLQQQVPRNSNGTGMVMTSGAMFGQPGGAGTGLMGSSGPNSSGGGMGGLGLLQQGMGTTQNAPGLTGAPGLVGIQGSAAPGLPGMSMGLGDRTLGGNSSMGSGVGMGGGMGGLGAVGGLGSSGGTYLNSFDPLRQPNSHNSLDNTGLGMGGATQTTADPPGLNYGASGTQKPGGFLQQAQQQQQQQHQQQMFSLGNTGMGGVTGLNLQDGLQGGLQQGLQGGMMAQGGYVLGNDGMNLTTGAAPGLDASAFGGNQQFNPPGFFQQ